MDEQNNFMCQWGESAPYTKEIVQYNSEPQDNMNFMIKMKIHKQYIFRSMTEIWKEFCGSQKGCIRFLPMGMQILELSSSENVTCCFEFYRPNILIYYYDLKWQNESPVGCFAVNVNANEFFGSLKTDAKNENLYMKMYVNSSLSACSEIFAGRNDDDDEAALIKTEPADLKNMRTFKNYYSLHYENMEPIAKVSPSRFLKIVKKSKNMLCTHIVISCDSYGVVTCQGYKEGIQKPLTKKKFDESYDYDDYDKKAGKYPELGTQIKIKKSNTWLLKLGHLNADDTINIYMAAGLPLVIKTNLGSYGIAFFTFLHVESNHII